MSQNLDELAAALDGLTATAPHNEDLAPSGQRPCPICGQIMAVEVFEGISLDTCAEHGVWLDAGELPHILDRARRGNRINRADLIRQARREGKVSGTLFGAWSLMWD